MSGRPRILDLYCCEGGAAMGYRRAGFDVVGIDKDDQPRYPFDFIQMDVLEALRVLLAGEAIGPTREGWRFRLGAFVSVHASPPCQARSDLQKQSKIEYAELVPPTRDLLRQTGLPYVIENVEGPTEDPEAQLIDPVQLCGANDEHFPELRVIRHRLFESNIPLEGVPCPAKHPLVFTHDKRKAHHGRLDQNASYVQVTGGGNCTVANKRAAMGVPWMSAHGANEAIPPAFADWIGRQVLEHLGLSGRTQPVRQDKGSVTGRQEEAA